MKARKVLVIALSLMLVLGCAVSTYAADRDPVVVVELRVKVVDENRDPVSGIIMHLNANGSMHSGTSQTTTNEDGIAVFPVPPGSYYMQELGYEDTGTVYNELYFTLGPLGDVKEDKHHRENVDFEIETEGDYIGAVVWPCYDYQKLSCSMSVTLDSSDFAGARVEVLNSDGIILNSWDLKEKGELIADLAPGSYTLREIVEINGYEMPQLSNIMVGGAIITPVDPNTNEITPEDVYYYRDKFQKWIDNQN